MQGPAVDLVLLAMLILFFGIQQRSRPQPYYRFWFAGWIFVFFGYIVQDLRLMQLTLRHVQDAVSFDLLLLGELTFLMSLLASVKGLRRAVLTGVFVGVPVVLVFNYMQIARVPAAVLALAVLAWEGYGASLARKLLPEEWKASRWVIYILCIGFGAALVVNIYGYGGVDLQNWTLAEVLLCSAVLYGATYGRRNLPGFLGTLGFAAWAGSYLVHPGQQHSAAVLNTLYGFRDIPQRVVAFAMIVQVFQDAHAETAKLAEGYRELYEDFRLLFERNPHPMWIYDEATSRILSVNRATLKAYGYSQAEMNGMQVQDLLAEPEPNTDEPSGRPSLPATVLREAVRVRHRLKDDRVIAADVTEHRVLFQGKPSRFVMAVDVTEMERESQELLHRAHHDALTGLPNRRELDMRIDACLSRSEREHRKAALLTIDVDHFKQVNDTYGHLVGDECLKAVASRLQSRIRAVDTLARSGGEEFSAIIGNLSAAEDAQKIAAMLLRIFDAPIALSSGEIHLSISIGVAIYPDDGTDRHTLMRQSDEALYRAKREGRNRAEFATQLSPVVAAAPAAASALPV
jgi:diguanylate cyclase (GGDEF)-like protein/PAS domain S-box-containing protein